MNLSDAITRGAPFADGFTTGPYNCPLGAAYLGTLRPDAVDPFWAYIRGLSDDSLCAFMLKNLHRLFPQLGMTVRTWPKLAEQLEQLGQLPRIRTNQTEYRQEIHKSLWKTITELHDGGMAKGEIAGYIGRFGL